MTRSWITAVTLKVLQWSPEITEWVHLNVKPTLNKGVCARTKAENMKYFKKGFNQNPKSGFITAECIKKWYNPTKSGWFEAIPSSDGSSLQQRFPNFTTFNSYFHIFIHLNAFLSTSEHLRFEAFLGGVCMFSLAACMGGVFLQRKWGFKVHLFVLCLFCDGCDEFGITFL